MSVNACVTINPCIACGACCAFYRVSFYWADADSAAGGVIPEELTERISPHLAAMKGTGTPKSRCVALQGTIGKQVFCSIYSQRPSVCRSFTAAGENSAPNELCDKARAGWGMPPLSRHNPINPHQPTAPKAA